MKSLRQLIDVDSLPSAPRRRDAAVRRFRQWLPARAKDARLAEALMPFVEREPWRSFDLDVFSSSIAVLNSHATAFASLSDFHVQGISHACDALLSTSDHWRLDQTLSADRADHIQVLEDIWHARYLYLAERAFAPLARPLAALHLLSRGKKTDVLRNGNRLLDELRALGWYELGSVVDKRIRNALAHGQWRFEDYGVVYESNGEEIRVRPEEFVARHDALEDACTGLLAAYVVFAISADQSLRAHLPIGLVRAATGLALSEDPVLERLVERAENGQIKLLAALRSRSSSAGIAAWHTARLAAKLLELGVNADTLIAPVDTGHDVRSQLIMDVRALDAHMDSSVSDALAAALPTTSQLFWQSEPQSRTTLRHLGAATRDALRQLPGDFARELEKRGQRWSRLEYSVERIHADGDTSFLTAKAEVVLRSGLARIDRELLRSIVDSAVRGLRFQSLTGTHLTGDRPPRGLPKRIVVRVHATPTRPRSLASRPAWHPGVLVEAEWEGEMNIWPHLKYVNKSQGDVGALEHHGRTAYLWMLGAGGLDLSSIRNKTCRGYFDELIGDDVGEVVAHSVEDLPIVTRVELWLKVADGIDDRQVEKAARRVLDCGIFKHRPQPDSITLYLGSDPRRLAARDSSGARAVVVKP